MQQMRENQDEPGMASPHGIPPFARAQNALVSALLADRRRGGIPYATDEQPTAFSAGCLQRPSPTIGY